MRRVLTVTIGLLVATMGVAAAASAEPTSELTVRSAVEQNARWISEHGFGVSIDGLEPGGEVGVRLDGVEAARPTADAYGRAWVDFPAQPVVDGQELVVEAEDARGRSDTWTITAREQAQWYIESVIDAVKADEPGIMVGFLRAGYPGTPGQVFLDGREVDSFEVGESHTANIDIPGGLAAGSYDLVVELATGERYEGVVELREMPTTPAPPVSPPPAVAPEPADLTEDRGGVAVSASATLPRVGSALSPAVFGLGAALVLGGAVIVSRATRPRAL